MSDNAAQYGLSNVEKLSVLCLDAIALDLAGTIALDIGKQNLLQLRNHFCLTREISEDIISTFIKEGLILSDRVIHLFRDSSKAKISTINLSNSRITNWSLQWLAQQRLHAIDLSGCTELSAQAVQIFLGRMAPHLKFLRMGSLASLLFQDLPVPNNAGGDSGDPSWSCSDQDLNSLSGDHLTRPSDICQGRVLLKASNLRILSLHRLKIEQSSRLFSDILPFLSGVQQLDLSECVLPVEKGSDVTDLSPLTVLRQLTSLVLYDALPTRFDLARYEPVLSQLTNLQHLDISCLEARGLYPSVSSQTTAFLSLLSSLPSLSSLDISGTHLARHLQMPRSSMSSQDGDRGYVEASSGFSGRHFKFLGLWNCVGDPSRRTDLPADVVTGDANMTQIYNSLQMYKKREHVCNDCLSNLYHELRDGWRGTPLEHTRILEIICEVMRSNKHNIDRQISGSAAMFHLIKCDANRVILHRYASKRLLRQATRTLYDAMNTHSAKKAMLRNGLLTFCHFDLPSDIMNIYSEMVKLLLNIIRQSDFTHDEFLQRISLYLLNNLVRSVDNSDKLQVGNQGAVRTMLWLIKAKLSFDETDEILEMAWSTLWNITDETEDNCERFLTGENEEAGLNLFIQCYEKFYLNGSDHNRQNREALLRNMMGLLGNVSEVPRLRVRFLKPMYLNLFRSLLESTCDGIEVSYHAAGILCHILSDGSNEAVWRHCSESHGSSASFTEDGNSSSAASESSCQSGISIAKERVLSSLVEAINRWDLNSQRSINYRSFKPILALLECDHTVEVRHWAVWALCNLTTVYPDKYCQLLHEEGGIQILQNMLTECEKTNPQIIKLVELILENVRKVFGHDHHNMEVGQL